MKRPAFLQFLHHPWVNEVLDSLSLREQIAQFIHIPAWSNKGLKHLGEIILQIEKNGIGGVTFFQGKPETQKDWIHSWKKIEKVPLMISMDAEWGTSMRLDGVEPFPYAMTIGKADDKLVEQTGLAIGNECREMGIHVNLGPVVDVNTNPDNPVIGFRSFGDRPEIVAQKAKAYWRGLRKSGVMAVAKHFPGHGDTTIDSHISLPIISHEENRLEQIELVPFVEMIQDGIPAIMSSHIHVKAWEVNDSVPVTHSGKILREVLRNQFGFEGLVFTDALDMGGIRDFGSNAEVSAKAFLAGHDALLFCTDVQGTIETILKYLDEGLLTEEGIEYQCRRILAAKYHYILNSRPGQGTIEDVKLLNEKIGRAAVEVVKNELDSRKSGDRKTCVLSIFNTPASEDQLAHHDLTFAGGEKMRWDFTVFQQTVARSNQAELISWDAEAFQDQGLIQSLKEFDVRIIGIHGIGIKAKDRFGISDEFQGLLKSLIDLGPCICVVFANPNAIPFIEGLPEASSVVLAYEDKSFMHVVSGEVISEILNTE